MTKIFVSYSTADTDVAEKIVFALSTRFGDSSIYFAPRENTASVYWLPRLGDELDAADVVLLLLGSRVGPWQELEYYEALRLNRASRGRPRIVPVQLGPSMPGMRFLPQFHLINYQDGGSEALVAELVTVLEESALFARQYQWRTISPYSGLAAMGAEQAGYFFGREALTAKILAALADAPERFIMLVGNSGVGKSSAMFSGALPAMKMQIPPDAADAQGRNWDAKLSDSKSMLYLAMQPGEHPVKTLALTFTRSWAYTHGAAEAEALQWAENFQNGSRLVDLAEVAHREAAAAHGGNGPSRILLYVDQAEETYVRAGAAEAGLFSRLLAGAAGDPGLLLVGSLRSDAYGRFQNDDALFAVSQTLDVPKMSRSELEDVIRKPTAHLGVGFSQPDAPTALADATAQENGGLPLLSFLLTEAWKRMQTETLPVLALPVADIDISKPLVARAERFLAMCQSPDALERLFTLRLTVLERTGAPARRRATEAECASEEWDLAQELSGPEWRILTATEEQGEPAVQVAHETLLRRWPRLNGWIEREAAFLSWRARTEHRASDWETVADGQKSDALLMGLELANARDWITGRAGDIPHRLTEFITASIAQDDAIRAEAEDRKAALEAERERSRRRAVWISRLSTAAALIFLTMGIAGWRLMAQEQAAQERAREATLQAEITSSKAELAAALDLAVMAETALRDNTAETAAAAMIALDSLDRRPNEAALRVLRSALHYKGAEDPLVGMPWAWVGDVLHSENGQVALWYRREQSVPDNNHRIPIFTEMEILDAADFSRVTAARIDGGAVPLLSPDGQTVFVAGKTRALHISGADDWAPDSEPSDTFNLRTAFSEDGETLFVVREDGLVELRSAPAWSVTRRLRFDDPGIESNVSFALTDAGLAVQEYYFDESALTFLSLDGTAISARFETNPLERQTQKGQASSVIAAGNLIATNHDDETIRIWNAETGESTASFSIDEATFLSSRSALSTNGLLAAAGGRWIGKKDNRDIYETEIAIWDVASKDRVQGWTYPERARHLRFSADNATLIAAGRKGLQVRAVEGGPVQTLLEDEVITALHLEASGALLAGTASGRLVRVSVPDAQIKGERRFDASIDQISADRVGRRIAVTLGSGPQHHNWVDVVTIDQTTGQKLASWSWNGGMINESLRLSPDGRFAVMQNAANNEISVLSTRDGSVMKQFAAPGYVRSFGTSDEQILVKGEGLEIYHSRTGDRVGQLGEKGGVYQVFYTQGSNIAVGRDFDRAVGMWNLATGDETLGLRPAIARSPDGLFGVEYNAKDGQFEIFITETGNVLTEIPSDNAFSVALSSNGSRMLALHGAFDPDPETRHSTNALTLWDGKTGSEIWSRVIETPFPLQPISHESGAFSVQLRGSGEDGKLDPSLLFFPAASDTPWEAKHECRCFIEFDADDPSGRYVTLWVGEGLELRNAQDGSPIWDRPKDFRDSYPRENATFLPGGEHMILRKDLQASRRSIMRRMNTATMEIIWERTIEEDLDGFVISKDGTLGAGIADYGDSGAILIFDLSDGRVTGRVELPQLPGTFWLLPDGKHVVTHTINASVHVWNIETGEVVREVGLKTTSDGSAHATGAMRAATLVDGTLRLWNTKDMTDISVIELRGDINNLEISPDGKTVAVYRRDRLYGSSVVLWSPEGQDEVIRQIPASSVSNLTFSPDSSRIALRERGRSPGRNNDVDYSIRVINLTDLTQAFRVDALPYARFGTIRFSGDAAYLIAIEGADYKGRGTDQRLSMLRAFDLASGTEIARRRLADYSTQVWNVPNTPEVIYRDSNRRYRRVSLPGTQVDPVLSEKAWQVEANPAGNTVLLNNGSGWTMVVDALGEKALTLTEKDGAFDVMAANLSIDGRHVLLSLLEADRTPESGSTFEVRDTKTGAALSGAVKRDRVFYGVWPTSEGTAFLSENIGVFSGRTDTKRQFLWWNWKTGDTKVLFDNNLLSYGAVSPDGTLFAGSEGAPDGDGGVAGTPGLRIWDAATGEPLRTVPIPDETYRLAFSTDNRYLAAGANYLQFVYDLETEEVIFARGRHPLAGTGTDGGPAPDNDIPIISTEGLAFRPGSTEVVLPTNRSIILQDLQTGKTRRLNEANQISRFDMTSDGKHLVTVAGSIAGIWDLDLGERIMTIPLTGLRKALFVGPDDHLVAQTNDGLQRILWRPERIRTHACKSFANEPWQKSRYRISGSINPPNCTSTASTESEVR